MQRTAIVTGGVSGTRDPIERIAAFLPSNYKVGLETRFFTDSVKRWERVPVQVIVIRGEDKAGWTLDGYVLPRLASGLIFAKEETDEWTK